MKQVLALVCLFCSLTGYSSPDPKFPVSQIPEDLKAGRYAVIREKESRFEINSINSSKYYYHLVITILNGNAKDYAEKVVGYDKLRSVKLFKCVSYDAMGNVIKKLKQSEIRDQSAYDGYSLFSDDRIKIADLSHGTYPYTVEFEYEIEHNLLYSIPDFFLYTDDEVSIQKSKHSIVYPKELKPRYKLFKVDEPKVSSIDEKETMEWSFENIKPDKFERFSPDLQKMVPNIMAAPIDFEFGSYQGKMDSWENFGKWQAKLNEGRNVLPEAAKQQIRELTKNAVSTEEKARLVYEYVQNKTRYVSIQLGIGGLQPFEARVVDETGYGDCKALSNYTVSLLKEAGVKAYYTTIMAGNDAEEVDPSFSSHQANHVIVAVPNQQDTLWLECTDQTNPFGYLGTFTGDRYGLMITEDGGKLVKTISYNAEQNTQSRNAEVKILPTGEGFARIKTVYSGLQYENGGLSFLLNDQFDKQKKWVMQNTEIPSFDIKSFKFDNKKDKIPSATVTLELNLNRFATISGKRLILTPNLMNRNTFIPEKNENRKTEIVRKMTFTDIDTITYQIPEELYPEFLPPPVKLKSRFGEYEISFSIDQGSLVYTRRIKILKGIFPASSYAEMIDFYKGISKADNQKLVFLNKT